MRKSCLFELRRSRETGESQPIQSNFHIFETTLVKITQNKQITSFGLTCPVLSWPSTRISDLKFRKRDKKYNRHKKSDF